jgi:hypothetical protein
LLLLLLLLLLLFLKRHDKFLLLFRDRLPSILQSLRGLTTGSIEGLIVPVLFENFVHGYCHRAVCYAKTPAAHGEQHGLQSSSPAAKNAAQLICEQGIAPYQDIL